MTKSERGDSVEKAGGCAHRPRGKGRGEGDSERLLGCGCLCVPAGGPPKERRRRAGLGYGIGRLASARAVSQMRIVWSAVRVGSYRRSQKGTTRTRREKGEAFGFDDGMGSRRSLAGQSVSEGGMGGGWGQGQGPPLVFPLRSAANRHSNKTGNDAFSRGQGLTEGRGIASTDVLAFIHIRPVLRCTTATMRASGRPRDCDS